MSLLVVGSLALDTVATPFDKINDALGGSATYISLAASYFSGPINLVGVVGSDFPKNYISLLEDHNIDTDGLQIMDGKTFRWSGKYHYDLNVRDTLLTELNVFEKFDPVIPEKFRNARFVCLGNIDPSLQLKVLNQMVNPHFVVCDTMNYWIEGKKEELLEVLKRANVLIINDSEPPSGSRTKPDKGCQEDQGNGSGNPYYQKRRTRCSALYGGYCFLRSCIPAGNDLRSNRGWRHFCRRIYRIPGIKQMILALKA